MSCSSARSSTPSARASLDRGLSSAPKSRVSPGSTSLRRKPLPFSTRNGFAIARARLMSCFVFMSQAVEPNEHRCCQQISGTFVRPIRDLTSYRVFSLHLVASSSVSRHGYRDVVALLRLAAELLYRFEDEA